MRATVLRGGFGLLLMSVIVATGCDSASGPPPVGSLELPTLPVSAEVGSDVQLRVVALDDLEVI